MVEKSNERRDFKTLRILVKHYDEPVVPGLAHERLVAVVQAMQIAENQGDKFAAHAVSDASEQVDALAESMRPYFEGIIGLTIGALHRKAVAEIAAEIVTHQNRKRVIDEAGPDRQSLEGAYDALIADGWKTNLSRDQWVEDDYERKLASMGESHLIGRLEYELEQIQTLFQRFVSQDGSL